MLGFGLIFEMPLAFFPPLKCWTLIHLCLSVVSNFFCARFDEKQDLRICTVRDPDNLPSRTPVWLIFGLFCAAADPLDVTTLDECERGSGIFLNPAQRTLARLRDANRSWGGCRWRPWLRPSVIQMDQTQLTPVTHQLWNHILGLLRGDTDARVLSWRWCYDSHGCAALRDATLLPAACCHVIGPLAGPAPWIPPCVSTPPLCLSTDGPDWENKSALCFRLRTKLQPNRMPSSRERHSCLASCRKSSN